MDDRLQKRFQQSEIEPPKGTWDAIEARLDREIQVEKSISLKFSAYEVEPPVMVWDRIASALDNEIASPLVASPGYASPATVSPVNASSAPGKIVSFPWKRLATAAAILAIVGLGTFFLFFNNPKNTTATTLTTVPNPSMVSPETLVKDKPSTGDKMILAANQSSEERSSNIRRRYRNIRQNSGPKARIINANEYLQDNEEETIRVVAPLITDESGNIISDPELILDPNEQYITVTSPNGAKTKISAKFMGLLDKLYGNSQRAHDEAVWNTKFENWKKALLQETTFIPASGNYMDILELKELLMEQ